MKLLSSNLFYLEPVEVKQFILFLVFLRNTASTEHQEDDCMNTAVRMMHGPKAWCLASSVKTHSCENQAETPGPFA